MPSAASLMRRERRGRPRMGGGIEGEMEEGNDRLFSRRLE